MLNTYTLRLLYPIVMQFDSNDQKDLLLILESTPTTREFQLYIVTHTYTGQIREFQRKTNMASQRTMERESKRTELLEMFTSHFLFLTTQEERE